MKTLAKNLRQKMSNNVWRRLRPQVSDEEQTRTERLRAGSGSTLHAAASAATPARAPSLDALGATNQGLRPREQPALDMSAMERLRDRASGKFYVVVHGSRGTGFFGDWGTCGINACSGAVFKTFEFNQMNRLSRSAGLDTLLSVARLMPRHAPLAPRVGGACAFYPAGHLQQGARPAQCPLTPHTLHHDPRLSFPSLTPPAHTAPSARAWPPDPARTLSTRRLPTTPLPASLHRDVTHRRFDVFLYISMSLRMRPLGVGGSGGVVGRVQASLVVQGGSGGGRAESMLDAVWRGSNAAPCTLRRGWGANASHP